MSLANSVEYIILVKIKQLLKSSWENEKSEGIKASRLSYRGKEMGLLCIYCNRVKDGDLWRPPQHKNGRSIKISPESMPRVSFLSLSRRGRSRFIAGIFSSVRFHSFIKTNRLGWKVTGYNRTELLKITSLYLWRVITRSALTTNKEIGVERQKNMSGLSRIMGWQKRDKTATQRKGFHFSAGRFTPRYTSRYNTLENEGDVQRIRLSG